MSNHTESSRQAEIRLAPKQDGIKAIVEQLTKMSAKLEKMSNEGAKGSHPIEKMSNEGAKGSHPIEMMSTGDGTKTTQLTKMNLDLETTVMLEQLTKMNLDLETTVMLEQLTNQDGTKELNEQLRKILNLDLEKKLHKDERKNMLEQLSKMILNLGKFINIKKRVSQPTEVPAKLQIYGLLGRDISWDNSKIYMAAIRNEWDSVAQLFIDNREKLTAQLSPMGDTVLHIAVGTNRSHEFVNSIVNMLKGPADEDGLRPTIGVRARNNRGDTALHVAAWVGNKKDAEYLVNADAGMVGITNNKHHSPLWVSAWNDDVDTLHYLLEATSKDGDIELDINSLFPEPGDDIQFLFICIKSGHYDVALHIIEKYPNLVWQDTRGKEGAPLKSLASKPDAFRSGMTPDFVKEFIYPLVSVNEELTYKLPDKKADNQQPAGGNSVNNSTDGVPANNSTAVVPANNLIAVAPVRKNWKDYLRISLDKLKTAVLVLVSGRWLWVLVKVVILDFWRGCFRRLVYYFFVCFSKGYIKEVQDEKLRHMRAELLVTRICSALLEVTDASNDINVYDEVLGPGICTAIKNGCIELIEKCIEQYPGIIWCTYRECSFFGLATKHRQEKVFNLIYQMSAYKIHTLNYLDDFQNTLHVAGELPPYHRLSIVTGPALQMQRELLWFQVVEKLMETSSKHYRNKANLTPREVFTEQHQKLLIEAREWTKATTASFTVVAALIETMTFAAMFTVPGGLTSPDGNSNSTSPAPSTSPAAEGIPEFINRKLFLVFAFTDTAALFFSAISVISFLSTLTCLAQEDFLRKVPRRLTSGFISLFLSLVATVVAFGATAVLMFESKVHWIRTTAIPIGSFPIILYSCWQFPLILELLRQTFGKDIFHKKKDLKLIH